MSAQILRRGIDRLKYDLESINPRPLVRYKLMGVPPDDASAEAKAAYQVNLDAAQADGFFVIQLVPLKGKQDHDHPNHQTPN